MDLLTDIIAQGQTMDAKLAPTVRADVGAYGELLAYSRRHFARILYNLLLAAITMTLLRRLFQVGREVQCQRQGWTAIKPVSPLVFATL